MDLYNGHLTNEISAKFDLKMMGEIEHVHSSADLNKLNEQFALQKQATIAEVDISRFYKIECCMIEVS